MPTPFDYVISGTLLSLCYLEEQTIHLLHSFSLPFNIKAPNSLFFLPPFHFLLRTLLHSSLCSDYLIFNLCAQRDIAHLTKLLNFPNFSLLGSQSFSLTHLDDHFKSNCLDCRLKFLRDGLFSLQNKLRTPRNIRKLSNILKALQTSYLPILEHLLILLQRERLTLSVHLTSISFREQHAVTSLPSDVPATGSAHEAEGHVRDHCHEVHCDKSVPMKVRPSVFLSTILSSSILKSPSTLVSISTSAYTARNGQLCSVSSPESAILGLGSVSALVCKPLSEQGHTPCIEVACEDQQCNQMASGLCLVPATISRIHYAPLTQSKLTKFKCRDQHVSARLKLPDKAAMHLQKLAQFMSEAKECPQKLETLISKRRSLSLTIYGV